MSLVNLHIKNMVCDRCIKVVTEELEKLDLLINNIKLGEAEISSDKEIDLGKVKAVLEKNGFELLEDKSFKIIEKIKTIIIDSIHHKKGKKTHQNYSELISKEIGKDYHYLSTLFSSIENVTIEKYIIHQKIEKVKELLIYDELNLSEIAFQLGYSSVAHLSSQFKQVIGLSPTEFKKQKNRNRSPLDQV